MLLLRPDSRSGALGLLHGPEGVPSSLSAAQGQRARGRVPAHVAWWTRRQFPGGSVRTPTASVAGQ